MMFMYRLAAEQKSVLLGREYTNIKYAAEFGNIGQILHFILVLFSVEIVILKCKTTPSELFSF